MYYPCSKIIHIYVLSWIGPAFGRGWDNTYICIIHHIYYPSALTKSPISHLLGGHMNFMHCIQVLCTVPKHYNNILWSNNTARTTSYILHTPLVHYSAHRCATTDGFCTPKFPISKNGSNRTYFVFCIEWSIPQVLIQLLTMRQYQK